MKFNLKEMTEKFVRLTMREKRTLSIGLLLLVAGFCYPLMLLPQIKNYSILKKQFSSKKQVLLISTDSLRSYREMEKITTDVRERKLFKKEEVLKLLRDLSSFTQADGNMLVSIKPGESQPITDPAVLSIPVAEKFQIFPIEIIVEGKYPALIKFLYKIQNYGKILGSEALNLSISDQGYPLLTLNLTLNLYVEK